METELRQASGCFSSRQHRPSGAVADLSVTSEPFQDGAQVEKAIGLCYDDNQLESWAAIMRILPPEIEELIETIMKAAATASTLGIFVGGICVGIYCSTIRYFPQEVSVGDGFLFIMIAACFGIVYGLFVWFLVSLGVFMSPAIRLVFKLILWATNKFRKTELDFPLAPFEWWSILFAPYSIFFIWALGINELKDWGVVLLIVIVIYVGYSFSLSRKNKIREIEKTMDSSTNTEEEKIAKLDELEKLKKRRQISFAFILVAPLFFGLPTAGQLLDGSMRLAHVRIEKSVVYVKEPFSGLLPESLIFENRNHLKGFTAFNGITILFRGLGKTTVIQFKDSNITRKIEIPNDQIIIEENTDK